ncbi:uncharacterized protein LOC133171907 [Saccostrea echinata]|uniref:uncharacterized protein LOC133171907 n=1 Tax=Saccostrea echinata TaxID=191078 RepID=UPI002A82B3B7|nr:uncharacterized protein LOC133171907 [Saccostrea echinata]
MTDDLLTTPVNIKVLTHELFHHPDKEFAKYLCDGFTYGFDTMISNADADSETLECRNLLSARNQPEIVDKLVKTEVEKGFVVGPLESLPFPKYRVSPIGVAIGKYSGKPRLIMDLSSPHDNEHHASVNSMIDKENCSLSYVKIDDAIRIIQTLGRGTTMCKTDISDAFKLVPVLPEQWHMFCFKWRSQYYYYTKLSFGCRSSPKIFDNLSQAVCWIAYNNYGIKYILHLLDDFITFEHPENDGETNMNLLYHIFQTLNIPMALHKSEGPTTCLEYLGIILDSQLMEARFPNEKLQRITEFLHKFQSRKSCTKRELLQLLGHLNFASRVILPGRSFVSHLIALSTTVKQLHHYVKINEQCREDMQMWLSFLSNWNGINLFYSMSQITSEELNLYTDASATVGYGGFFKGNWFSEPWTDEVKQLCDSDTELSIAFFELYPIVVASILWGHMWKKQRIVFMCDNSATVAILNKGRSKSVHIMPLMRRLTLVSAQHNFVFSSIHVPGKQNTIADALSRLQISKFRSLVPSAQEHATKVPPPKGVLWSSKT